MHIKYLAKPSNIPTIVTDTAAMVRQHRDKGRHRRIIATYRAAHPLCERCLHQGRTAAMDEVHHIIPVHERGGTHEGNLLSLCIDCHTDITANPVPAAQQLTWKESQ